MYDLLAKDVRWTITGSSPLARTYTSRQEFLDRAIRPIFDRLSVPTRPDVRTILAEGDQVVALWSGHATARDGQAYDNEYCWILRIDGEKVREATAFFDAPPLTDLLERVDPQTRA